MLPVTAEKKHKERHVQEEFAGAQGLGFRGMSKTNHEITSAPACGVVKTLFISAAATLGWEACAKERDQLKKGLETQLM